MSRKIVAVTFVVLASLAVVNSSVLPDALMRVGSANTVVLRAWETHSNGILNFRATKDDVWVTSLPSGGSTIVQEMVWLLMNNCDLETAKKHPLGNRFHHLESSLLPITWKPQRFLLYREKGANNYTQMLCDTSKPSYNVFDNISAEHRFIHTNLPLNMLDTNLLDSNAKVIYVARHPKDRIAAYHYYLTATGILPKDRDDTKMALWNSIKAGTNYLAPEFDHILQAFNKKGGNLLFLFYEDIMEDIPRAVARIAGFLGENPTEEQKQRLIEHLKLKNLQNNPMVCKLLAYPDVDNAFLGTIPVGGYKTYFSANIIQEMNVWIAENLDRTRLHLPSLEIN